MLDNVLSWAVLAVAGWIGIAVFLSRAMEKPGIKIKETDSITKIYPYL